MGRVTATKLTKRSYFNSEGRNEMTIDLLIVLIIIVSIAILIPLLVFLRIYIHDSKQKEHSILRNYPVLGKVRYIFEKIGPEFRQYLFNNNNESKPFNRREFEYVYKSAKYHNRMIGYFREFEYVYKSAKYHNRMIGYGSERDFKESGFYIVNNMFPSQREEMKIDQHPKIKTRRYTIDNEKLLSRKEHHKEAVIAPFYLPDEEAIILGVNTVKQPFKVKGIIGQSAMSFGSLGDHAITALSKGLGMAGGTWMNTGEGSLSPYHLKGDVDVIMQISPGLFGVRTVDV